ncbi:effector-associated constant component EACC1 [Streptomyces palmae]|uniref:Uncharacterized protein n=1 Tax=Streptomyces palmae TaxID=1701085 RepID=A0A4Z0HGE8_9ACTN|nr:hypothetical protein [Streptomyces palmae]TGB19146.1 hypothetical protein E4099_00935 [Streptomyces palmae]
MRVRIGDNGFARESVGSGGADLTSRFADWITRDRTVGRYVAVTRERSGTADGGMSGDLLEWIGLTLSTGFSTASLIYSHLNFRASLPPRQRAGARMVVEHNGVRVVIEDGGAEDVARLALLLGTAPGSDEGTLTDHTGRASGDSAGQCTGGDSEGAASGAS